MAVLLLGILQVAVLENTVVRAQVDATTSLACTCLNLQGCCMQLAASLRPLAGRCKLTRNSRYFND